MKINKINKMNDNFVYFEPTDLDVVEELRKKAYEVCR